MKPILATNIDGLLIDHRAFVEPHKAWFDRAIKLTKDNSLEKWKGAKDYFQGVNQAMEKILPNATKEQRTKQARDWYQEDVIEYIKNNPEVVSKKRIEDLKNLKNKFTLALITTNTKEHIQEIIKASELENIYDIIFATNSQEEPNKKELIQKFIKEFSKPNIYLASRDEETINLMKDLGIKTISSVEELKE